jgi:hypothetical protein
MRHLISLNCSAHLNHHHRRHACHLRCIRSHEPHRSSHVARPFADPLRSKRKGLDKALYQIEQAVKRARSGEQTAEDDKAIVDLQSLLEAAAARQQQQHSSPAKSSANGRPTRRRRLDLAGTSEMTDSSDDDESESPPRTHLSPVRGLPPQGPSSNHVAVVAGGVNGAAADRRAAAAAGGGAGPEAENLAIDDAENPLQLLARASDLQLSPKPSLGGPASSSVSANIPIRPVQSREALDEAASDVQSFFTAIRVTLDVGDEIDPISMGLVTEEEADALFSFFHKHLAHTRWGMDPLMYTVPFTRSRSAFLFTSIMAASALFIPTAGALSKRLSAHCKALAHRVLEQRHRSVEIVLAFMVNVPWMFPGKHSTDDETCWYVAMATAIAIDLSLHKVLLPADAPLSGNSRGLVRGDCLDPGTALALDGFGDIDPASELGKRFLRRRERCWLALFVLERG